MCEFSVNNYVQFQTKLCTCCENQISCSYNADFVSPTLFSLKRSTERLAEGTGKAGCAVLRMIFKTTFRCVQGRMSSATVCSTFCRRWDQTACTALLPMTTRAPAAMKRSTTVTCRQCHPLRLRRQDMLAQTGRRTSTVFVHNVVTFRRHLMCCSTMLIIIFIMYRVAQKLAQFLDAL